MPNARNFSHKYLMQCVNGFIIEKSSRGNYLAKYLPRIIVIISRSYDRFSSYFYYTTWILSSRKSIQSKVISVIQWIGWTVFIFLAEFDTMFYVSDWWTSVVLWNYKNRSVLEEILIMPGSNISVLFDYGVSGFVH